MSASFVPPAVRRDIEEVVAGTGGAEPEIAAVRPGMWRCTWGNGRVRMQLDVKVLSRGRVQRAGSRLWIDGQESPLAVTPGHFYRIWAGASYEDAMTEHDRMMAVEYEQRRALREQALKVDADAYVWSRSQTFSIGKRGY